MPPLLGRKLKLNVLLLLSALIIFEYKHCKRKEIRWVHHKLNKLYIYHRLDEENEIAFLKMKYMNEKKVSTVVEVKDPKLT